MSRSPAPPDPALGSGHTVAIQTLGCARNEVDSEELAGRLTAAGYTLVDDPADASAVLVNTCGFVEAAKKDSVDALLALAERPDEGRGRGPSVVAVGCLAERYGAQLAEALPEADAVLGFDAYADIGAHLRAVLDGSPPAAHTPQDRRRLLPLAPLDRPTRLGDVAVPGHRSPVVAPDLPVGAAPASGPRPVRRRLDGGPTAPVKLASGCDRRCSFCAIPSFRGAFVSRPPAEVLDESRWLAQQGVRELFLVSENTTSYGKDLGDLRALETLLPALAELPGVGRVRVSYLQPAETRPGLISAITGTPGVADYFDLSFQHASATVLRRMRRFGDADSFLDLLDDVRRRSPDAGVRTNVIVGFPGETEDDLQTLVDFLVAARLDVVGVFGYSDEDGTEAAQLPGKLDEEEIRARVSRVSSLVEELTAQRAEERLGERVEVLVEELGDGVVVGRAAHQGPEVDGTTTVRVPPARRRPGPLTIGDLVRARVVGSTGVDLIAEVIS